jgi:hypothetical protein
MDLCPSEWLAALAGAAPAIGTALSAARRDRGTQPAEFVPLFGDIVPGGGIFGFWYDEPRAPLGPAYFRRGWTEARDESPLEVILRRLEVMLATPDLAPLEAIELIALQRAGRFFAGGALPTTGHATGSCRPAIASGLSPALSLAHGDPRWSAAEVAAREVLYQTGDKRAINTLIGLAERELSGGKPAFALVLGHELRSLGHSARPPETTHLLSAAYRALGRDLYADLSVSGDATASAPGSA